MLLRHSAVLRFGGLLLALALLRLALGTQVVVSDNLADLALDRTLRGLCDAAMPLQAFTFSFAA